MLSFNHEVPLILGDLIYQGRIDSQVKLRGYRVELSSIESHLSSAENVSEAACVVQEHGSVQKLVAFLTPKTSSNIDVKSLKSRLTNVLPSYMVPSEFRVLKTLPRQMSGKIDRKTLTKMNDTAPNNAPKNATKTDPQRNSPNSPLEQFMLEVITRHLGLDQQPNSTVVNSYFICKR